MTWAERLVAKIFDRRGVLLAGVLAFTAVMAVGATRVGVENRLEVWFLEDDPTLASYREFQRAFGGEETVVVALHRAAGILDREGQRLLSEATTALASIPEVLEVRSLANATHGRMAEIGGGDALRARLLGDPRLAKRLVSADGETALLFVRLRGLPDLDARRPEILRTIKDRLSATGLPYFLAGSGVLYDALNRAATVDSGAVLGAAYALMVLLLWMIYRRIVPALVTVGAVLVAVVWTMGAMGFAGRNLNVVTLVVPTLVLIIGVSDCIHILQSVAAETARRSRRERVLPGVAAVLWPCLFNTITSMIAFLSLLTSPMAVIRDLGLFCALGLAFAFLTSVVVCTFALAYAASEPKRPRSGPLARMAGALASTAEGRPGWVLAGAAVVALALGWGALRLEADTYALGYLPSSHRVRQDSVWIERRVGPYLPLEFVVRAGGEWKDPELLRSIAEWQRRAEAEGAAGWSASVADGLAQLANVQTGGGAWKGAPLALSAAELGSLVDGYALRVTFGIPMQSARGIEASIRRIQALAALPPGARVEASGYLPLYVQMMRYMVDSQVSSLAVAFGLVFLAIGLMLRSVRLALLAIPANVLPVFIVLGVMGIAGIPLDAATVTIAALVLGLVVDDTVHFLYRLREEEGRMADGAVARTLGGVGPTLISTTVVLALGFSVLGFAQVSSVAYFGMLLALAMVSALVADLLITPAVVELVRRVQRNRTVDVTPSWRPRRLR